MLPSYAHVTAYADDAYITLSSETISDPKDKIGASLDMDERYTENIGIVINKDKTELYTTRQENGKMELKNVECINALGVS